MSAFIPQRRYTQTVFVGNIPLGSEYPVRIQSMTNTDTMNTQATVEQVLRMVEVGSEYVRITAPDVRAAENLYEIKNRLHQLRCEVPLIADIHFQPKAAEVAAAIVEKVRINPGNYISKNISVNYSDDAYREELERVSERLYPLIEICKAHHTAMRIGTNHGSLGRRILDRYGDTPEGMVASAMEFIRICEKFQYHQLILSMKSSQVKVMIYATRMLTQAMAEEHMFYPIHLGVTEAGSGEDARLKSAAGIGTLLAEGIGDTIRVSLTENPEKELPVARELTQLFSHYAHSNQPHDDYHSALSYERFQSDAVRKIGGGGRLAVITETTHANADYSAAELPLQKVLLKQIPLFKKQDFVIFCIAEDNTALPDVAKGIRMLRQQGFKQPLLISVSDAENSKERMKMATVVGFLSAEGLIDGLLLEHDAIFGLDLLQATGDRMSKAEFIACPSCGRTKYDIQAALRAVKERCQHLKGLKIAVMGCVVNGPGEMADADYGYIGAGNHRVNLYKGKQCVLSNIDEDKALDELLALIKASGDWEEEFR